MAPSLRVQKKRGVASQPDCQFAVRSCASHFPILGRDSSSVDGRDGTLCFRWPVLHLLRSSLWTYLLPAFLPDCAGHGDEKPMSCLGPQERFGTRLLITGVTPAKIKQDRMRDGSHRIQSASNTHDGFGSSLAAARPSSQHRRECSRWSQGQENTDWNDKHWEGRQT